MRSSSLTIVTIISPSYEKVGREMVKRVRRFTGHDVKVLECPDDKGFETKVHLDRLAGKRPVIFMDCDLWPIRHWSPENIHLGNCFQYVPDSGVFNPHSFCHTDCHKHGLRWDTYPNSGLLFWNNQNPEHREVFKIARQSWKDLQSRKKEYADKTDQAHIAFGLLGANVPVQFLPEQYNFYAFATRHGQRPAFPREIINLHGAGIPAKSKYSRLKVEASVFGQKVYPMHQDAINWEHHKLFNLR